MKLTTYVPLCLIGSALAAYITNLAMCQFKSSGGAAYAAAAKFCKPANIDWTSDYAKKGVVATGPHGSKARAYITHGACEPGTPSVDSTDCLMQMMWACRKGDTHGYGTVRGSGGGCLTFGIASS